MLVINPTEPEISSPALIESEPGCGQRITAEMQPALDEQPGGLQWRCVAQD